MNRKRGTAAAVLGIAFTLIATVSSGAGKDRPADPFDYNFCGGERVYPIIGINFSTACGPRNQIALGRRGKLMWLFPGVDDATTHRGAVKLDEATLVRLSLLAEVASINETPALAPGPVMYKLGINFSSRTPKYVHAPYLNVYTPANRLVQEMLKLVPDQPRLPDCPGYTGVFDPTLHGPARREAHRVAKQVVDGSAPD